MKILIMVIFMRAVGRRISSMDLGLNNTQMETDMKEILLWGANLVKGNINFLMAKYIRDNFIMG